MNFIPSLNKTEKHDVPWRKSFLFSVPNELYNFTCGYVLLVHEVEKLKYFMIHAGYEGSDHCRKKKPTGYMYVFFAMLTIYTFKPTWITKDTFNWFNYFSIFKHQQKQLANPNNPILCFFLFLLRFISERLLCYQFVCVTWDSSCNGDRRGLW